MKTKTLFPFLWISLFFLVYCINDSTSIKSPIVKIEKWNLFEPGGLNADITINTHENGSFSCEGNWSLFYAGADITCDELSGSVSKDSTYFSVYSYGKATISDIHGVIEYSSFDLTFRGHFKNERSSGNWELSFDEDEWGSTQGRYFEGILISERIISQ